MCKVVLPRDCMYKVLDYLIVRPRQRTVCVLPVVALCEEEDGERSNGRSVVFVSEEGIAFAVAGNCRFLGNDEGVLRLDGYWSEEGCESYFLATSSLPLSSASDIFAAHQHNPADTFFYVQKNMSGRLECAYVFPGSSNNNARSRQQRDCIGEHFGEEGKQFFFLPQASSRIDRDIAERYRHAATVRHRVLKLNQSKYKNAACWLTDLHSRPHAEPDDTLLMESDDEYFFESAVPPDDILSEPNGSIILPVVDDDISTFEQEEEDDDLLQPPIYLSPSRDRFLSVQASYCPYS